jgi:hypothetical protein
VACRRPRVYNPTHMRTRDDIEAFLANSGYVHEEVADGTWLVHDPGTPERIVVRLEEDLVVFRLKVLELSRVKKREELLRKLLELNASDMLHGGYGIADGAVVLTAVMRLETLDQGEFGGTIDDFVLAVTKHREVLASFC